MGRGRFGEGENQRQGQGQGQAEGMAKGKGKGSGQRRYGVLANRQGSIRDRLDGLLEQLRTLGTRPPEQFEGAGRAMREAEKALGESNLGRATQQQTLALDRLRQGAQSVAEQVLQTLSSRVGQGGRGNRDPLGRPERTQGPDLGTSVRVPDQIDIQRAREILDELRKRLGEPSRPMLELDYLERLIQKF
jgi:DNA anti-recombination protein RmuC